MFVGTNTRFNQIIIGDASKGTSILHKNMFNLNFLFWPGLLHNFFEIMLDISLLLH